MNETKKIYPAMIKALQDVEAIGKNKRNQQQGFQYRGVDDAMNELHGVFARCGIFCVPEVLEQTREDRQTAKGGNLIYSIMKVKFTFYADDGSSVSSVVIGEGMDSGDKASNKALSVAFKYAVFQAFCIPTEAVDPDATTPPASKPIQQPKQPQPVQTKQEKKHPSRWTAEQGEEMRNLLSATYPDGTPVFSEEEKNKYRQSKDTPDNIIDFVKQTLQARIGQGQQ